jgi:hypothetical protein
LDQNKTALLWPDKLYLMILFRPAESRDLEELFKLEVCVDLDGAQRFSARIAFARIF